MPSGTSAGLRSDYAQHSELELADFPPGAADLTVNAPLVPGVRAKSAGPSGLRASRVMQGSGTGTFIDEDSDDDDDDVNSADRTLRGRKSSTGQTDEDDDNEWHELHELEAQLADENHAAISNLEAGGYARLGPSASDKQLNGHGHDESSGIDSALAMVKSVVKETDDPSLPNLTFRVLFLGTILCAVGAAISQLFFFKSNAPSFSGFLIILLSYPAGHWLAQVLPTRFYTLFGHSFTLNPGPFSVKEHVLIAVLAGSGSGAAYGADIITIQELYYHQDIGPLGGVLLLLSTQLLGFGLSGLVYDLLVRPSKMVWPSNLASISLFNTLHGESSQLTWKRLRFFRMAFLAIFVWQFMPSVVAPVLTSFAMLCVFTGPSAVAQVLGSGYTGFGLLNISFDWSVIGSQGGLYTPWFASLNRFCGFVAASWFTAPLLYFTNFWNAMSFDSPIGAGLYTRSFNKFNLTAVIDPATLTLDTTKWEMAKPLLLTPWFAITYGLSFATLTSAVVTVGLWHWDDIKEAFAATRKGGAAPTDDIHVQIMEATYEPVPRSWYAYIGGSMVLAAIIVVTCYPMQLPVWGLLLSLLVALVFLPPCGIIAATTGTVLGLNVITEFIAGFLLPGEPIANVTFKCYGYVVMAQALSLVADLKLALYCKIKPKAMFICQCYGTALGAIVNYIYVRLVINAKRPYLDGTTIDPTGQWNGRLPQIFYSASVIWGLVGPARFFDGNYKYLYLGFPLGALLPFIPWYLSKKYPHKKWLPKISIPLLLDGSMSSPQIPTNVLITGFLSAWLSQRFVLRRHPKWYEKYNFVLSAALDAGTSIQALVVFILGLGSFPEWWGNSSVDTEHCKAGS